MIFLKAWRLSEDLGNDSVITEARGKLDAIKSYQGLCLKLKPAFALFDQTDKQPQISLPMSRCSSSRKL